METFRDILRLFMSWFVIPVSIVFAVMHNKWEWPDLRGLGISFAIAIALTAITVVVSVLLGFWIRSIVVRKRGTANVPKPKPARDRDYQQDIATAAREFLDLLPNNCKRSSYVSDAFNERLLSHYGQPFNSETVHEILDADRFKGELK